MIIYFDGLSQPIHTFDQFFVASYALVGKIKKDHHQNGHDSSYFPTAFHEIQGFLVFGYGKVFECDYADRQKYAQQGQVFLSFTISE